MTSPFYGARLKIERANVTSMTFTAKPRSSLMHTLTFSPLKKTLTPDTIFSASPLLIHSLTNFF
jgi:hypothetical protein